ncbi:MAG: class I SAM-dependent methyltransferase [Sulfuricaulis sp.]|nr:class I SAM-dependent methyltransferase [Sulfuricaulis sp.]
MSTQNIYTAVIVAAKKRLSSTLAKEGGKHLDIGAGRGALIQELRHALPMKSSACDFHVERFVAIGTPCAQVNLNHESLPYPDAHFDLVTCSEVVEHVENYRALLREAFRVTAIGGVVVVTTPNVLNANSRARYLVSGFANLFGPLPVRNDKLYSTGGHITPIPYFYLAHALLDSGFDNVELSIDKVQKTSVFWLTLLAPFIFLGMYRFMSRERKKFKTLTVENKPLVASHFTWPLLVGRTIVVSAVKPSSANSALQRDATQTARS